MSWIVGVLILLCATPSVIGYPDSAFLQCWHRYQESLSKVKLDPSSIPKLYTDSIHFPVPPIYEPSILSNVVPSNHSVIFALGPGTTATHGLIGDLYRLNIPSVHWIIHTQIPDTPTCQSFLQRWTRFCQDREFRSMSVEEIYRFIQTVMMQHDCVSAFMDFPIPEMFLYLRYMFPNAIYLFTDREPTSWAKRRVHHHPLDIAVLPMPNLHPPTPVTNINVLSSLFVAHREFIHCVIPSDKILDLNYFTNFSPESTEKLANVLDELLDQVDTLVETPMRMLQNRTHSGRIRRNLGAEDQTYAMQIAHFILPRLNTRLDGNLIAEITHAIQRL